MNKHYLNGCMKTCFSIIIPIVITRHTRMSLSNSSTHPWTSPRTRTLKTATIGKESSYFAAVSQLRLNLRDQASKKMTTHQSNNMEHPKSPGKYISIWKDSLNNILAGIMSGNESIQMNPSLFKQAGNRNNYGFRQRLLMASSPWLSHLLLDETWCMC